MASQERYQVFFRPDLGAALQHFFAPLGKRAPLPDGGTALYLSCTQIDASNPTYLEVTLDGPDDADPQPPLRIPHHLVVAISGPTKG